ncbi:4-coumarate--CoA ligase 4 [Raphanus sativus]|nr:4-coumarate--CoA ligase 4 [Raphanus sativus]
MTSSSVSSRCFHTYAFNALILSAMRTGAAILILPRYELNLVMELIQKYKVTVVPVAPPVVLAFVKSPETERYDLSSVKMMISGAAMLRKELEEAVLLKFPSTYLVRSEHVYCRVFKWGS